MQFELLHVFSFLAGPVMKSALAQIDEALSTLDSQEDVVFSILHGKLILLSQE